MSFFLVSRFISTYMRHVVDVWELGKRNVSIIFSNERQWSSIAARSKQKEGREIRHIQRS